MIVGFDLEDSGETFPYIDNASIFSWPLDHIGAFNGQFLEMCFGTFIAAVLGPHQRKYPQFCDIGFLSDKLNNPFIFVFCQVVFF
jgi:hypothetical protein